jgi:hypothetical protein
MVGATKRPARPALQSPRRPFQKPPSDIGQVGDVEGHNGDRSKAAVAVRSGTRRLTLQQVGRDHDAASKDSTEIMDIVCITGPVPGVVTATISHRSLVRSLQMEVAHHPSGGWHARLLTGQSWGLRCHAVPTAILLEAAEVFADAVTLEPAH